MQTYRSYLLGYLRNSVLDRSVTSETLLMRCGNASVASLEATTREQYMIDHTVIG